MAKPITIGTSNGTKLQEWRQILDDQSRNLIPQFVPLSQELSSFDVDEPYDTLIANAIHKARAYATITGGPAVSDDSGLFVTGLGGNPGVKSARYIDARAFHSRNPETAARLYSQALCSKLLQELDGVTDRSARFICVTAMVLDKDDPNPIVASGTLRGSIVAKLPSLETWKGWAYEPVFIPVGNGGATLGETPRWVKHTYSHRARAIRRLIDQIARMYADVKIM